MSGGVTRTSLQLFRDCLRLVKHIAPGESAKGVALRAMVKTEFRKNKDEEDEGKIEVQKSAAVRALANYMLYESGTKDAKLGKAMKQYHDTSINSAIKAKEEGLNAKKSKVADDGAGDKR
mmetsp:Transcript_7330/g.10823  ORF Transcript_7330/g.10823 Transcript_7330/m.10823 type:complete len:120 (-) Transcript_7330:319-678(-)|eukprot:CAMPEP_0196824476 /NCGR_PEP_ID=MMETSP1362-20130617/91993_1 /TAXON_ID=163516 /ORGANISM="Leptocylindrus danicus, Strain CCMP1856" /LENGTH=119 /DNA_ID=CAMNT_0042204743 /DNA_START=15 /DNA_END=374 /DNA_ORIENTATION=-